MNKGILVLVFLMCLTSFNFFLLGKSTAPTALELKQKDAEISSLKELLINKEKAYYELIKTHPSFKVEKWGMNK